MFVFLQIIYFFSSFILYQLFFIEISSIFLNILNYKVLKNNFIRRCLVNASLANIYYIIGDVKYSMNRVNVSGIARSSSQTLSHSHLIFSKREKISITSSRARTLLSVHTWKTRNWTPTHVWHYYYIYYIKQILICIVFVVPFVPFLSFFFVQKLSSVYYD